MYICVCVCRARVSCTCRLLMLTANPQLKVAKFSQKFRFYQRPLRQLKVGSFILTENQLIERETHFSSEILNKLVFYTSETHPLLLAAHIRTTTAVKISPKY